MDNLHNVNPTELNNQIRSTIKSEINEKKAIGPDSRLYVKLEADGSYNVEIRTKAEVKNENGTFVKIPNRLVLDCLNKSTKGLKLLKNKKVSNWSQKLKTNFISRAFYNILSKKDKSKGLEDFQKNILKIDFQKQGLDIKDLNDVYRDLHEFKSSEEDQIKEINKGRAEIDDVKDLLFLFFIDCSILYKKYIDPILQNRGLIDEKFDYGTRGLDFIMDEYNVENDFEFLENNNIDFTKGYYEYELSNTGKADFINKEPSIQIMLNILGISTPIKFER